MNTNELEQRLDQMLAVCSKIVDDEEHNKNLRKQMHETTAIALKQCSEAQRLLTIESIKQNAIIMCLCEMLHNNNVLSDMQMLELSACATETSNETKLKLS